MCSVVCFVSGANWVLFLVWILSLSFLCGFSEGKKNPQQTATRKPAANFYICDRWGHLAPWLRLCPLCCAAELSWLCPLVVVCSTLLPSCRGFPNHIPFVLMGWAPCWGYISSSFCSMHYPSSCFHPAGSSISGLGEVGSAGALGRALLLQSWLRALPLRVLRIVARCTHCCLRGVCSLLLMQVHALLLGVQHGASVDMCIQSVPWGRLAPLYLGRRVESMQSTSKHSPMSSGLEPRCFSLFQQRLDT